MKYVDVRRLMRLMVSHRIDSLEVNGDAIKMTKSIHLALSVEQPEETTEPGEEPADPDEDVLFYSSGSPKLALREMEQRSSNKPEPPKVQ